jgi:hypothetical protein
VRAAADAIAAEKDIDALPLLARLAAAGAEPDFATAPWSVLRDEKARARWRDEVCHGIQ